MKQALNKTVQILGSLTLYTNYLASKSPLSHHLHLKNNTCLVCWLSRLNGEHQDWVVQTRLWYNNNSLTDLSLNNKRFISSWATVAVGLLPWSHSFPLYSGAQTCGSTATCHIAGGHGRDRVLWVVSHGTRWVPNWLCVLSNHSLLRLRSVTWCR